MSELNSSQSNSKVSVSDQRIAAGHSGSSKNDISGISDVPCWEREKPTIEQLITLFEIETDLMILNAKARLCIVNYDPDDDLVCELHRDYKKLGEKYELFCLHEGIQFHSMNSSIIKLRKESPFNDSWKQGVDKARVDYSESTKGFAQLIDEEGVVVMQREVSSPEGVSLCDQYVWHVRDGAKSVFVKETEYCHPFKFFTALKKSEVVSLYQGIFDVEEVGNRKPDWVGMAQDVNNVFDSDWFNTGCFLALSESGEWLGTSEF